MKKLSLRIKSLVMAVFLSFSCLLSACELGITDIPSSLLFPDMEEGQDLIGYLGNMLIDQYKGTVIEMIKDGLMTEFENGSLDEVMNTVFSSEKFNSFLQTILDKNQATITEEMKKILQTSTDGLLNDQQIAALIQSTLENNTTLYASIRDSIITEFTNPESEFHKRFITGLTSSTDFMSTLAGNPHFIQTITEQPQFLNALTTNPDFVQAIAGNQTFLNTLSGNTAFLQAIAGNTAFVAALLETQEFKDAISDMIASEIERITGIKDPDKKN